MLQFLHPLLLLLLPLPWLVRRMLPAIRLNEPTVRIPFAARLQKVTGNSSGDAAHIGRSLAQTLLLHGCIWFLLVCAMARPQWLQEPLVRQLPMRDLLLAVDLSGSMQTRDFFTGDGRAIDRLSAVKAVLSEFLARRTQDRSGLIVFGSKPYVQVPFTRDQTVIQRLLADTEVRMAGPRTMIGDAVGLAITLFERSKTPQRVLILLTDGNDTGSLVPPRRAAEIARDRQLTIYTIGVGDPAAAGEEALDTETLASMAATTGGRFFMANDREELQKISREIDRLTPQQVNTLSVRPRRDLFQWPLGLAFIITLLYHGSGLLITQVHNLPLFPWTTRE